MKTMGEGDCEDGEEIWMNVMWRMNIEMGEGDCEDGEEIWMNVVWRIKIE